MKRKLLFSTLMGFALLLSACGTAATPTATPIPPVIMPATDTAMPPVLSPTVLPPVVANTAIPVNTPTGPATLAVSQNATLASFLIGANGMTVYLFTKDSPGTSTCAGNCATTWPPVLSNGAPIAGTGVDAALLGTITRADGSVQVTYNSWPLYYYSKDAAAGDTTGEGFGGYWHVITATGSQG